MPLTRREWLAAVLAGAAASAGRTALAAQPAIAAKRIPSSGETLPPIGVGTARRYQGAAAEPELAPLREALRTFVQAGGRVIDTAPSYGDAEAVVGRLVHELGVRDQVFLATKVRAQGREAGMAEIGQSFRNLRTERIDLIAVHNLMDVPTQLATLREYHSQGRIRYVGLTTSFERQHREMATLIRTESPDFVQVDYALDNRAAEATVLPAALEHGAAVMVNLPFGRGRLFKAVQGRPLPGWAAELGIDSWAQYFLKYLASHPAVTCVVPGTATARYAADNAAAMRGPMPDAAQRERMRAYVETL